MFAAVAEQLSDLAIPLLLFGIITIGFCRRVKVYEVFVEGASEGFQTAVRIMPFLVAMMVSVNIFRDSGALELFVNFLSPVLLFLGIPDDLVPLAIMRPLSGTAALGLATELLNTFGPDSMTGQIASTILGSTDTTFYVLTVYFGAIGIKEPSYAVFVGLLGDIVGFLGSIYICNYLFAS